MSWLKAVISILLHSIITDGETYIGFDSFLTLSHSRGLKFKILSYILYS